MKREEAMEIVKKLYNDSLFLKKDKEAMLTLIPELAESEDEMIRKKILAEYKDRLAIASIEYKNPLCNKELVDFLKKAIAYLEKQKPAEKPNLVAQLREHLANTPKEQLEKEWKELEPWNNIGPTVKEFLYNKPAEWSDEDKKWFNVVSQCGLTEGTIDWIRSLINRYYWKPSEEQMDALNSSHHFTKEGRELLKTLYRDINENLM